MKPTALTRITSSAALAVALIAGPLAGAAHAAQYSIMADSPANITYGDATPSVGFTYWVGGSLVAPPSPTIWDTTPVCSVTDNVPSGLRNGHLVPDMYFTGCVAGTLLNPGDGTGGTENIFGYGTGELYVLPAPAVTVTGATASYVFGTTPPSVNPTIAGFVNGDTFASSGFTAPTCGVYTDNTYATPVTLSATTPGGLYVTHCSGGVVNTDLYDDATYTGAIHYVDGAVRVQFATGNGTYTGSQTVAVGSRINLQSTWPLDASCGTTDKFEYEFSTDGFETVFYATSAGALSQQVLTSAPSPVLAADYTYDVRGHYLGSTECTESWTDPSTLTVYALGDSAYGGGWYSYTSGGSLSGRSNFGFAVSKKPGTTNQYRGQLLWTFKNTWRFKASLNNFGKQTATPPKGTLAGTGTLYLWNGDTATWDVYATGVNVNVALQATYTPLKKSDPAYFPGSFKISIGTVPTSPAPPLPTMFTASSLLKGGNIKIN